MCNNGNLLKERFARTFTSSKRCKIRAILYNFYKELFNNIGLRGNFTMDTRQLRYVQEIAKCKSITKAADKLYISQSGLNQQLLRIEKELGVTLFDRDTHSLNITEAGEVIVEYAEQAIQREKHLLTVLDDIKDSSRGEIKINLAMEQGANMFCSIYPEFQNKFPNIVLKLEDHTVSEQYELLLKNNLDIGMAMITQRDIHQLEYIHLTNERFLLGVPATHKLATLYHPTIDGDYPIIDLSLCKNEKFALMFNGSTFRQVVDPCFEDAGFEPNIIFDSRTNHISALMVQNGICLTFLPETQAKLYNDIRWFKIESNPSWECCILYNKENPPKKAGRFFIDLAVKYYESDKFSLSV